MILVGGAGPRGGCEDGVRTGVGGARRGGEGRRIVSTDARENTRRMLFELATAEMAGTATPELRIRILVASISLLTVVKRCGCGVEHNALSWSRLPPRGVQRLDGLGPDIELRNCSCGSTLGIELPGEPAREVA